MTMNKTKKQKLPRFRFIHRHILTFSNDLYPFEAPEGKLVRYNNILV